MGGGMMSMGGGMMAMAGPGMGWPQPPVRPGEPDCAFYMKTGRCKFGVKCVFNHPPPAIAYPVGRACACVRAGVYMCVCAHARFIHVH